MDQVGGGGRIREALGLINDEPAASVIVDPGMDSRLPCNSLVPPHIFLPRLSHSKTWCDDMEAYLKREEDYRSALLKAADGSGKGAAAAVQAMRVIRRLGDIDLSSSLHEQLLGDSASEGGGEGRGRRETYEHP